MRITNTTGVSLLLAVWLLHDEYEHNDDPNYISATGLLKPVKQAVLAKRVPSEDKVLDVSDLMASSYGTAVHDSVDRAWRLGGRAAMRKLGYPAKVADNIVINPTDEDRAANPDLIPIWLEQRSSRKIDGWTVSGKFDAVLAGRLFDIKTTSVWTAIKGRKVDDYRLQLSVYRWLNPDLITEDHGYIQYVFTDWSKAEALRDRTGKYPKARVQELPIELMPVEQTEAWIRGKLSVLSRSRHLAEAQLPPCTDEELWRDPPRYKYFADPSKVGGRSTKNFDEKSEAHAHMAAAGKGVVVEVPGTAKACLYCPAFSICTQKDAYHAA